MQRAVADHCTGAAHTWQGDHWGTALTPLAPAFSRNIAAKRSRVGPRGAARISLADSSGVALRASHAMRCPQRQASSRESHGAGLVSSSTYGAARGDRRFGGAGRPQGQDGASARTRLRCSLDTRGEAAVLREMCVDVRRFGTRQQPPDETFDCGAFHDARIAEHVFLVERA